MVEKVDIMPSGPEEESARSVRASVLCLPDLGV